MKYDNNNTKNNGIKMFSNMDHDITAEIMLSSFPDENNNNKEGQLMFNDGLHVILNQGDMVIYSNLTEHNINKISSENTVLYKIIIHMKINKD
jgi:predicted 2-oxoglutarate/Fe(II)-dependent dioxygenase YbiX